MILNNNILLAIPANVAKYWQGKDVDYMSARVLLDNVVSKHGYRLEGYSCYREPITTSEAHECDRALALLKKLFPDTYIITIGYRESNFGIARAAPIVAIKAGSSQGEYVVAAMTARITGLSISTLVMRYTAAFAALYYLAHLAC